jgi:glycosyltransferase involved in cell wall biosynthesis
MMRAPRVSVGLPVFNGEKYLPAAMTSILGQTVEDLELVVCDNASTDRTAEICAEFAARDPRVRVYRNDRNLGAAPNYTLAFLRARAKYFKWAACDDICAPTYLARCIAELDQDPTLVLCHTATVEIDSAGAEVRRYEHPMRLESRCPHERLRDLIVVRHPSVLVFGVARRSVLAKTSLIGSYVSADRVLLAELALHGRLRELPDPLFFRRVHTDNSIWLDKRTQLAGWYDTRLSARRRMPHWRVVAEIAGAVGRAPLSPRESLLCYTQLGAHVAARRPEVIRDVISTCRAGLAHIGPLRRAVLAWRAGTPKAATAHDGPPATPRRTLP